LQQVLVATLMMAFAGSFLASCGNQPVEVGVHAAPPPASTLDRAREFLRHRQSELIAACSRRAPAESGGAPPTTTVEGPIVNGMIPYVGPGCDAGYVLEADQRDAQYGAVLDVRLEPTMDAPVEGHLIAGVSEWFTNDDFARYTPQVLAEAARTGQNASR